MFRRRERPPQVVDITDDLQLTFRLLDDTHAWRHRLVEYAVLADGDHVTVTSGYQIELPPALMTHWVPDGHSIRARLLLPVTTRPKRPLLAFAIDGPSGAPAPLLSRDSIAVIQAGYLQTLMESSPIGPALYSGFPGDLLEAICAFTPDVFRWFAEGNSRIEALRSYLAAGLGLPVTHKDVERWIEAQQVASATLVTALTEPPDLHSSSEEVLLALPRLHGRVRSIEDIDNLVTAYAHAVSMAAEAGDTAFLIALAEYGRRWEAVVEVEVPLEQPCQIKLHEARPITIDRRGWVREPTPFPLGDARSAHLQIRVSDPHVNVNPLEVRDASNGQSIGIPWIESARHTRESVALYSSERERPYYVNVSVRLRVIAGIRIAYWFVGLITVAAICFALLAPDSGALIELLTLLTIPTTFAVALVLVRETSALAVRLQSVTRTAIAGLTVILWVITLARLAIHV